MEQAICIGCDQKAEIAAYAIMHEDTYLKLKISPAIAGPKKFHAAPVCQTCHRDPANRKRELKSHFSPPNMLPQMLAMAGSTTGIQG